MLLNAIAVYPRPVQRLTPACVVASNIFGEPTVIGGHTLAATQVTNAQSFGGDRFVKTYEQTLVDQENSFGRQIIGHGLLLPTFAEPNTFGFGKLIKTYTQTKVAETNTFGSPTIGDVSRDPPVIHDSNSVNMAGFDGTSKSITLANVASGDIIVLAYSGEKNDSTMHTVASISDDSGGSGFTWHKRSQSQMTYTGTLCEDLEVWWCAATANKNPLTIAVSISDALDDGCIGVFRVTGCSDTSNPWDSNSGLPATANDNSGSGVNPSLSISTVKGADLILAFFGTPWSGQASGGSGFTELINQQNNGGAFWNRLYVQSKPVTSPQSGLTVDMGNSPNRWAYIVDALTAGGSSGGGGGGETYETPAYANAGGTGNRTSIITVTTDASLGGSGGPISRLVDGNKTNGSSNACWFVNGQSGRQIAFDFGHKAKITEATWYQNGSAPSGTWKWQGSNDGSTFTDLSSGFTLDAGSGGAVIGDLSSNDTGYRYYRMQQTGGTTNDTPWLWEIEFKIGNVL